MFRKRDQQPDETEIIASEDTQEYFVARSREEPVAEPVDEYEFVEEDEAPVQDEVFEDGILEDEVFEDEAETAEYEEEFDEYDEPEDDFYEEDEALEPETGTAQTRQPSASRVFAERALEKASSAWSATVAWARAIDFPAKSDLDPKVLGGVALIVLASLAIGVGAYFIGKGTGDDVDVARLEGEVAGKQAGAVKGASEGYPEGFKEGRDRGFRRAYAPAYKLNFKRAFEQAGLDVPRDKDIDVPTP